MKLRVLEIHNIASLEDAVIHFDLSPLADEPIFLINGPTGAGKSTLLDAICLALYNQVPRLQGAAEKNVGYTEKYNAKRGKNPNVVDDKLRTIHLDDPRQLMRRGTAECFVHLTFDVNGHSYKASWGVKRVSGRADGNMSTADWALADLTTGEVVNKDIAVKISNLVGLTFDQFCRTVLLAQGEFTKFLQSKTEEKSAILQKITGTDIYEKVGRYIGLHYNKMEGELRLLRQKKGDIKLLTEEEKTLHTEKMTELKAGVEQQQKEVALLKQQLDWLKRHSELQGQLETTQQNIEARQIAMNTEKYRRQQRDIEDYASTVEARAWLMSQRNGEEKYKQLLQQEEELRSAFVQLDSNRVACERHLQELTDGLQDTIAAMSVMESDKVMLEGAQGLLELLSQLDKVEDNNEKERKAIDIEKGKEDTYNVKIKSAAEEKQKADNAVLAKTKEIATKNEAKEALHPETVANEMQQVNRRQQYLARYLQVVSEWQSRQDKEASIQQEIDERKAKVQGYRNKEVELRDKEATAKGRYDHDDELYEAFKEATGEVFKLTRRHLHKDDICPLCGEIITQNQVSDPDFDTLVKPKIEAYNASRQAWVEAQAAVKANKGLIDECEKGIKKLQEQKEQQTAAVREQQDRVVKGWIVIWPEDSLPVGNEVKPFTDKIEAEQQKVIIHQQEVEEQQKTINALVDDITKLNREKDCLQKTQNEKSKIFDDANHGKELYKEKISQREKLLKDSIDKVVEYYKRLNEKISYSDWQQQWQKSPESVMSRLSQDADKYTRLIEDRRKKETEQSQLNLALQSVREIHSHILAAQPSWQRESQPVAISPDRLQILWQKLQGSYTTWSQDIKHCTTDIDENKRRLSQYYLAHPVITDIRLTELSKMQAEVIAQLKAQHEDDNTQLTTENGKMKQLQEQWQQHIADKPAMADDETMERLHNQEQTLTLKIAADQTQMGALQRDLEKDSESRQDEAELQKKIEAEEEKFERWSMLYNYLGDNDGKKFRSVAQSFILRHLLDKANVYLRCFTDRYELTNEPGTLVILAQDRLINQPPQFVKVLSGGETFMVSLSLALALSRLNSHIAGVDILFIDEGFGTLDENSLNSVMDTLSRLHEMGGRKVGIISHVEELETRIPTQIKVTPIDATKSRVEVVCE
jgi:exonuclease SbcC